MFDYLKSPAVRSPSRSIALVFGDLDAMFLLVSAKKNREGRAMYAKAVQNSGVNVSREISLIG
jgi:hypothetical protein